MLNNQINIEFKPSAKQYEAWERLTDNHTTYIGYGGSGFSGKTWLMCYWLTTMCLAYPDTGWGLGRKELTNLKRTSLLTLFKVFKECNIQPHMYNYNQQLNTITFHNGSQIFLIDTAYKPSDPLYQRFGGYELTGCAVDESAETDWKAIDILYTRTGRRHNRKYGLTRKMLETFNPAKNHVYARYYKPWKTDTLKESYHFIKALPKDNPSPEVDEYIKGIIENSDPTTVQRLVYGNFEYDDDPNSLIDYDLMLEMFCKDVTPIVNGKPVPQLFYITVDVARLGRDKSTIFVWEGLQCIKIIEIAKCKLTELSSAIENEMIEYKVPKNRVLADEDGVGGGIVDFMHIKGFVNGSKALYGQNYMNLKTQCYYKLADLINQGKMGISNIHYRDVIVEELEQVKSYKVDSDGKLRVLPKDIIKKLIGRSPDYSDNMMMRCWFEVRQKKANYAII